MNIQDSARIDSVSIERRLTDWLEQNIGGKVTGMERQGRWRPAWFVDMEDEDGPKRIYVRGERTSKSVMFPLKYEYEILRVLEKHGVPVPHVYGICPDPHAIIMDFVRGRPDLSTADSEEERRAIQDQLVDIYVRIQAIDPAEFVAAGLRLPEGSADIMNNLFEEYVTLYRDHKLRPDPTLEYIIKWVRRNVPRDRDRICLSWGDGTQFLFQDSRVTTVMDFELAYLGDPLHDIAGMPLRATSEPLGDLKRVYERYMEKTGTRIDPKVWNFHLAKWSICTSLSLHESVNTPLPIGSLVQYNEWYVHYIRYSLELMAAWEGIELKPLAVPEFVPTRTWSMGEGLVGAIEAIPTEGDFATFGRGTAAGLAKYMHRMAQFDPVFEQQDRADVEELLGAKFDNWVGADAALEEFVLSASPEHDAVLIPLFYRRVQRQAWIMEPLLSRPEAANRALTFEEIMSGTAVTQTGTNPTGTAWKYFS
jgi:aminoglycoside phosphotransferase (APT) family kinase protein